MVQAVIVVSGAGARSPILADGIDAAPRSRAAHRPGRSSMSRPCRAGHRGLVMLNMLGVRKQEAVVLGEIARAPVVRPCECLDGLGVAPPAQSHDLGALRVQVAHRYTGAEVSRRAQVGSQARRLHVLHVLIFKGAFDLSAPLSQHCHGILLSHVVTRRPWTSGVLRINRTLASTSADARIIRMVSASPATK